jgi:hypothetical protein
LNSAAFALFAKVRCNDGFDIYPIDVTATEEKEMTLAALSALAKGDMSNFLAASKPGGIERQEAAGQRTLVESAMLPKEINGTTREQLEAIGFKFGADVDELFVQCELPAGWTKRGTDHSMHSDLLDEHRRKRAGIFYKAAFYDRRASMSMNRRFSVDNWKDGSSVEFRRVDVSDCDTVIKEFGEAPMADYKAQNVLTAAATAWLDAEHPDWRNPLACW